MNVTMKFVQLHHFFIFVQALLGNNRYYVPPETRALGFILISMRIAKIRTPRLARFSLYNWPVWLKTRSDGDDVAIIPRSSRAAAFR